jgi:prevent-host-death family protein
MRVWPVQDAKARFSELLDSCMKNGPQVVTKRGIDAAVLVPLHEWKRLQNMAKPGLKELLLDASAKGDLVLPSRGGMRRRSSPTL